MPRKHATVNLEIWSDPDFRALPPAAQHLYFTLWTSADLTFCGVHDWRPARLAKLSCGWDGEHIQTVADCLSARHFFVIDPETEEALVRSWARWDGLLKQPRMAVAYVSAYSRVASPVLRSVLVRETKKIKQNLPDLACWKDERVTQILDHPSVSAKDLPTPKDPFGAHFGDGFGLGLPQTLPKVWGSVWTPPTPSPTPTPKPPVVEGGAGGDDETPEKPSARKRASALPDDFEPNETNRKIAADHGVDIDRLLPQFLDHHRAKGSTFKDWHAALNTWIRREKPTTPMTRPRSLPLATELEQPPDGLSPAEYAEWDRGQREKRRRRA